MDFKERLSLTHLRYAENRLNLLPDKIKKDLNKKSKAILEVLRKSGVGGIIDKEGVKCLHTHLADFLVNKDNPVGELVWARVDWPVDCRVCDWENV